MTRSIRITRVLAFLSLLCCTGALTDMAFAQTTLRQPLITQPIDEGQRTTLAGTTRPQMKLAIDRGRVADDLPLEHVYLQLKRSAAQQQAVDKLINDLHDQNSPQFHRWLTADQIAERFGPADQDVQTISSWLASHHLIVNVVYTANGVIDFSGSAGAIREAFQTEIHNISVKGEAHIANTSEPQIPAALAPAIAGIVSLADMHPKALFKPRPQYTVPSTPYGNFPWQLLVPADLGTIYDINPLYAAGVSGKGQTIAVVEDSDVYSPSDWYTFRQAFGLAQQYPEGSFQQIQPQPSQAPNNGGPCLDPGANGDDAEATGDAQDATAIAPSATIVVASCASTNTTWGLLIALQNLIAGAGRPPSIISISYGYPEADGGSTNQFVNELYEIGVLEGSSIFVSAGDGGAAGVDVFSSAAMSGIAVSALASTRNDVAVGGTDFADTYLGEVSTYWSATNGKYFNSALSYIPEVPWNDSCAGQLTSTFFGFSAPYGTSGFCNSPDDLFLVVAGSGGPSGCAYGTPSLIGLDPTQADGIYAVTGGTCKGYAKPLYQRLVKGNPADGVRDIPDVSLFASGGWWGHYAVFCFSDPNNYGAPCTGAPSTWVPGGGTSQSAPFMAGIQALINQAAGGRQGNPNFVYYALAAFEYDFNSTGSCNSTLGNKVARGCIFHDVTLGDNVVNCLPLAVNGATIGTFNCFLDGAVNGVLSLSNTSYQPAYPATPGWDFATGLGSVDAFNLARAWPGSRLH
jgi:subtilase family serine protease